MYAAIQVLRNAYGGGGVTFSGKKRYEGVRYNVISATRGWVGVQFCGKKHYVTLEWPLYYANTQTLSHTPCKHCHFIHIFYGDNHLVF